MIGPDQWKGKAVIEAYEEGVSMCMSIGKRGMWLMIPLNALDRSSDDQDRHVYGYGRWSFFLKETV